MLKPRQNSRLKLPVSFVTDSRKEIECGRIFFFLIIRSSNRILAQNHVSSDGFGPQPPVTSSITQPTWRGCRFDLARDLGENIAHSCGRVIIDFFDDVDTNIVSSYFGANAKRRSICSYTDSLSWPCIRQTGSRLIIVKYASGRRAHRAQGQQHLKERSAWLLPCLRAANVCCS